MMRLWLDSYARSASVMSSATISIVTHTVIIAAWVYVTLPASGMAADSLENKVRYIPPPDHAPGRRGTRESVHYVELAREGAGSGEAPRVMGEARPTLVTPDETVGRAPVDTVLSPAVPPAPGAQDSVFTILDVDTAVVRSGNSAAPAYPLKLLSAHIVGYVAARFVVDTTGFADTTSFEVLKSTHPEFVSAVRDALPYMRFKPAKIGPLKVRQLVEQMFSFRINDSVVAAPRRPIP